MNYQQLMLHKFERRIYGAIKVGDVCIWQNVIGKYAYLNGTETTVIGINETGMVRAFFLTNTRLDDKCCAAEGHELRKKAPSRREIDTLVTWDECAWKPPAPKAMGLPDAAPSQAIAPPRRFQWRGDVTGHPTRKNESNWPKARW